MKAMFKDKMRKRSLTSYYIATDMDHLLTNWSNYDSTLHLSCPIQDYSSYFKWTLRIHFPNFLSKKQTS